MKTDEVAKLLRYPLYGLYHIETIDQSSQGGYLYDIVPGFNDQFDQTLQAEMLDAIEQALRDSDFDFEASLPNLPFNNDDIRKHLSETLKRLRRR
jgi:hypothetical protein